MAEKKKADLVATAPLVIARFKDGTLHHFYEGAVLPEENLDPEHLKQLQDEGNVGSPDEK